MSQIREPQAGGYQVQVESATARVFLAELASDLTDSSMEQILRFVCCSY